ncbi:sugar phosphate isomerase/epimerase family protein [Microbacterium sp. GXF0217]
MSLDPRVICSTITLRHLPLAEALAAINDGGFQEIDLGALPGVCDHVPYELDAQAVKDVAATVRDSGLSVRSVNGDIGDLNAELTRAELSAQDEHADHLFELTGAIGGRALVLPNGAQAHDPIRMLDADLDVVADRLNRLAVRAPEYGVELWVEAPHWFRLVFDLDRTAALLDRLDPAVGVVCDVSHITASGSTPRQFLDAFADRTRHVHIRDAERGFIHHSVGKGIVDFADLAASLHAHAYSGALALELETRDIRDEDRAAEAVRAGEYLSRLLSTTEPAGVQR